MRIRNPYRSAVSVSLATAFILLWVNGAVGVTGSENNDANLMVFGVLAVGIVGAVVARFQPRGMAFALIATAIAQAFVTLVAIIGRLGHPASGPLELLSLNGFFIALWVVSACLFRQTARTAAA
ncbi:MAG: hypothetical protein OXU79_13305 [Gemmatimonadota bacterium]|nr:hypothetical protein [Gemmatimonadota bacterium]